MGKLKKKIKKDITFIYMDSAEKSMYLPISEEAEKRGYSIQFSDNKFEKCEIGFYCQHVNFPQFSSFSVIMLHDIIQQYSNWPDIWFREPWNKYDIGILPSNQWEDNWNQCSQWSYARPKVGMFKVGWPKADSIAKFKKETLRDEFYIKYGLDPGKRTVLYAPAWENDGKQDDFVKAMQQLDVNILIKQADWNKESFPEQYENVRKMYDLHKNLPKVVILPPSTNIFSAIAVSDILVSEESSTMSEAAMLGIPAVSVSDWLIPDTTPSRFPKCDYDFVVMTLKAKLAECIQEIVTNYDSYHAQILKYSEENFLNMGNCSKIIMDIIDDCVEGEQIRYPVIKNNEKKVVPSKKACHRLYNSFVREFSMNYCERYPKLNTIYKFLKIIKQAIVRE